MLEPARKLHEILNATLRLDFIGPLLLRLYLAAIFWMAGTKKIAAFDDTVAWFGNPDCGLGLPFPELMAFLAATTDLHRRGTLP